MRGQRIEAASPDAEGRVLTTGGGLSHCTMEVFRLQPGDILSRSDPMRETCLVLLSGIGFVAAHDMPPTRVGGRRSPFEAPGHAVYFPGGRQYALTAESLCEVVLCHAAGAPGKGASRIIPPCDWAVSTRGAGNTRRTIRDILPETAAAESLLVVEVVTPGGHWSSFPPHKHDTDDWPRETALEEVYYHRFAHPDGFGFQRIYTDDRATDLGIVITDGCAVLVPRGYHPVSAAPGSDLYYLNVMAGPRRAWRVKVDPRHATGAQPSPISTRPPSAFTR